MEGVLAVQEGSQPRLLAERLRAMVPAEQLGKPANDKDKSEKAKKAA
jgi:chemotaxis protein MotA